MNPVARFFSKLLHWRYMNFVARRNPFRERRLQLFLQLVERAVESILDVGFGRGEFEDRLLGLGVRNRILAIDLVRRDVSGCPNLAGFVVADASWLPFADRSIDLVYCNSTIEHVGEWSVQRKVFAEIERVGRKFFVQTPNRRFPIELHHMIPFFQYWPLSVQRWFGQHILGHYERVWLLDRRAIDELAHSGERIAVWQEKWLGLTKSFVLLRERPLE